MAIMVPAAGKKHHRANPVIASRPSRNARLRVALRMKGTRRVRVCVCVYARARDREGKREAH